jgi:hypothetical protein
VKLNSIKKSVNQSEANIGNPPKESEVKVEEAKATKAITLVFLKVVLQIICLK